MVIFKVKIRANRAWLFFGKSLSPKERFLLIAALLTIEYYKIEEEPRKLKDLLDDA